MYTDHAATLSRPRSQQDRAYLRVLNVAVPLVLTLAAAVAVLEVGLRVFYRLIPLEVCASDPIVANYYCQPYYRYDKPIQIGYSYRPGFKMEGWWDPARSTMANLENEAAPTDRSDAFWYVFQADEMGFPNPEIKWRDAYDVVIAGDSFVTRSAPRTWIEILRDQTGMSTLVLGASSWSTLNEIAAIRLYGLDKHPQWVVIMYFEGNDLFNTAQYMERQASGLSWKEFDMRGVAWYRKLLTLHMLKYWIGKLEADPDAPRRYRYPVTASTEAGEIDMVFKDIHLLPMSAGYDTLAHSDEFMHIRDELVALDAQCKAQGTQLLLVYVPCKEHVYWSRIWDPVDVNNILERTVTVSLSDRDHGTLQWEPTYLRFDVFYANHNAQEMLLADMAAETGISYLNLTPLFWHEAIAHGELYNYADPHWNQAGNQLAADAIGAVLFDDSYLMEPELPQPAVTSNKSYR
jgi:hypothetical protein